MAEHSPLLLELARTVDELLQAAARASSDLRGRVDATSTGWRPGSGAGLSAHGQLAELLARTLDCAEGPALATLRSGLREEQQRWAARAARDPNAARVRDVIAAVLTVLEPDAGGPGEPRGRRTP